MNHFLNGVARALTEAFDLPGPILEIGSYQVAGQEEIAELRSLFPDKEYLGIDIRPGPGVDLVGDAESLPLHDGTVGTVIAMNTFEHVPHFWRAFDEAYRVLRPDGALLVACPFYFHIHSYPNDYWRFTPEAFELLLERYPSRILGWHGPAKRPANVWALAYREERPPISRPEYEHYRRLMGRYARQPVSWLRKWRYRLGRVVCGSRVVAPYLEQERWESVCRTSSLAPQPLGQLAQQTSGFLGLESIRGASVPSRPHGS
jgi:SAM-dependent methyltransferase